MVIQRVVSTEKKCRWGPRVPRRQRQGRAKSQEAKSVARLGAGLKGL